MVVGGLVVILELEVVLSILEVMTTTTEVVT